METLNQHVAQSCSYTTRCHRRCNRIFVTTATNLKVSMKVHEVMRTMVDPRALLSEDLLFEVGPIHLIQEGNCLEFKLISSVLEFEFGVFTIPGGASLSVMVKVSSTTRTFQGAAMVSLLSLLSDKPIHTDIIPCYNGNTFFHPNFINCSLITGSDSSCGQYLKEDKLFFKVVLVEDSCQE